MQKPTQEQVEAHVVPAIGGSEARELRNDVHRSGALLQGHFALSSGHEHSPWFLWFRRLAQSDDARERIARLLLAEWGRHASFTPLKDALFLAPESAGALLADELAHAAGGRLVLSRIDAARRPTTTLVGSEALKGRDVVLVNDVTTTQSALEVLRSAAVAEGARPVAAFVYGAHDRSRLDDWQARHDLPALALVHLRFSHHDAAACPGALKDVSVIPAAELN